jgi:hypothetical protein
VQTTRPVSYALRPTTGADEAAPAAPLTAPLPLKKRFYWEHRIWGPWCPWRSPPQPWVRLGAIGASNPALGAVVGHILAFGKSGGHYEILTEGYFPKRVLLRLLLPPLLLLPPPLITQLFTELLPLLPALATWQSRGVLFCFVRASAMP